MTKRGNQNMTQLYIYIYAEEKKILREKSKGDGLTMNELVRQLIQDYIYKTTV